jgi:predicted RNA-binding protein
MLGYSSDVFMTFKSFSDVLTFLSDEYRIDSINNTGVYLKK